MISRRQFALTGAAALALPSLTIAAPYTSKTVTIIVPTSPGPGVDALARFFQAYMSKQWKSAVVVENKAGAGGLIATEFVAKAPADGTVVMVTTSAHFTFPYLRTHLPFDPVKDFTPVAQFIAGGFAVAVASNSPFKTIHDLLAEAKRRPGTIGYGSAGIGTPTHLAGAQIGHLAGVDIVHVGYKDASKVIVDIVGGTLQMGMVGTSTAMTLIQSGKLRALAVTTPKRVPALADIPTLAESGLPDYDVTSPILALTPAGTPQTTVSEVSRVMLEAASTPEFLELATKLGYVMDLQGAAKLRANMPAQFAKWKRLVEVSGAKPE